MGTSRSSNDSSGGYNPWLAAGLGGAGAGFGSMMSKFKNPSDAAMGSMDQIPETLKKYLGPYMDAGSSMLPDLKNQYGQLTNDPGARLNQIGKSFQGSPGFDFALKMALQGANHAAAAGGMVGSPQHEFQNMELATNMANQNYNQYLGNALGLYGKGLEGEQNIYNTGAQTGVGMGEDMASWLAQKAKLQYEGQNTENQHEGGAMGSILGGLGTAAGAYFGGPVGAAAGGAAGKEVGGWF